MNTASLYVITLAAADPGPSWSGNTHRVVLAQGGIQPDKWVGWPDPTDPRNSDQWHPGKDQPLEYPKFAWRQVPDEPTPLDEQVRCHWERIIKP